MAIPSQRVFIDTPDFYRGCNLKSSVITDVDADRRFDEAIAAVLTGGRNRPIWLHYDEATFSLARDRLRGWRWEALRVFFRRLYGPNLRCAVALCGKPIGCFDLDHIAPVSSRYHQTLINFRPLCAKCNRQKGDMIHQDPFQLKLMLPEDLRTRELDDIHRSVPPWLGRMRTPASLEEIRDKLARGG